MNQKIDHPRFHVADLGPAGGSFELSTAEAHHAMHVLRLGVGDAVELFDGRGGRALGQIEHAKHGKVSVALQGPVVFRARPVPAVGLCFAVPKGKRLDWLLEKATELGVAWLWPIIFERSVSGGDELSPSKQDRWLTHCIAAAKQSGLDFLPEIRQASTLPELAKAYAQQASPERVALVGDLSPTATTLAKALCGRESLESVLILVGPEGGITERELDVLRQAGFVSARLGGTVLRVETAAIAMLAGVISLLPA